MDLLWYPADSTLLVQSARHELTDFQDKTSISTQALYGLREDTGVKGNEYAMLTTAFYLAYMLSEAPSTYALQRLNLGKGLSAYMVCWGCMVIAVGLAKNYTQLVTFRSLQGVFESTISPGFRESHWKSKLAMQAHSKQFFSSEVGTRRKSTRRGQCSSKARMPGLALSRTSSWCWVSLGLPKSELRNRSSWTIADSLAGMKVSGATGSHRDFIPLILPQGDLLHGEGKLSLDKPQRV